MLERFLKKYVWAANLLLLFLAAWLFAKMANTFVAVVIRPKPQVDLSLPSAATPRAAAQVALDPQRLFRLIGLEPPSAQEATALSPVRPQTCNDATATPVRTDLRLALVASVLSEQPRWSLATVLDLGTREARIYGVGDAVQGGATLVGLQRIREERDITGNAFKTVAILCNGGTKEYVDFDEAAPSGGEGGANVGVAAVPPPKQFSPGGKGGAAPLQGVRQLSDGRYEVCRSTMDQQLGNLSTISTQARIVPSFKNGVANGFKLFSIQPGSLYSSIGVENGDVIQRINGYEINSPDRALELLQKLRESSHVVIETERGGQAVKKEYNITGC